MSTYKNYQRRSSKFKAPRRPIINSIIALGNCMIDITSPVTKEILEKHGLKFGQTVFTDEKNIGCFSEFEKNPDVKYTAGGSIENSLRILSWVLNMEDKGIKITMLGAVGNDDYKNIIINKLKENKVNALVETIENKGTSRCAVGILNKERCLLSDIRASCDLSDKFVKENIEQIYSNDALLIEGYFIKSNYGLCKQLCEYFSKEKKTVIVTLSSVFIVESLYEEVIDLCKYADMIFCNSEEAEALAKGKFENVEELFNIIHKKLSEKTRTLVMTAGKNGVYCSEFDYKKNHMDFVVHALADLIPQNEIVDLNGAGDSFLGGFIAQYLMGGSLISCCKIGNRASCEIIHNVGCTFDKDKKFDFSELESH